MFKKFFAMFASMDQMPQSPAATESELAQERAKMQSPAAKEEAREMTHEAMQRRADAEKAKTPEQNHDEETIDVDKELAA